MADNNRRPEQPICDDANKQENRDHDRRNEVFHGSFFLKTGREIQCVARQGRLPACRQNLHQAPGDGPNCPITAVNR
jgi:hypothetical protein